ncbi:MAG: glycyl-radical enzyme activating protein [Verrucomicrobiia bacterium]
MRSGLVFNIQRYSIYDGPGIRTTVFLKGCPLNCLWCHNPEGILPSRQIIVFESRCVSCGKCVEICPTLQEKPRSRQNYVGRERGKVRPISVLKVSECRLCGDCVEVCPSRARQFTGVEYGARELVQEVLKDRMFFEESNGGVTFSGGEPLAQPEFLIEVLKLLKREGIHTAVDTCGYAPQEVVRDVAKETDLFLFDIKLMSPELHRIYTGVTNELILENLALLNKIHNNIWIRIPVITDVNTDQREITAMADFIRSARSARQINLLPYHKTGIAKGKRINIDSNPLEFDTPSDEILERIKNILSKTNLPVKVGG